MKAIFPILILLLVFPVVVHAEDAATTAAAEASFDAELEAILSQDEEVPVHKYPDIKPEFSAYLGYWSVGLAGSEDVAEYEYIKDSAAFGGHVRLFEFPHRAFLNLDLNNKKDYFGEARYALKDLVFLRWISSSLFHNTDNVELLDLNPATSSPGVDIRDAGRRYGIKTALDKGFLRLKMPDYAAHAYLDYLSVRKTGDRQQRSLLGSGWFDNPVKASIGRDVDYKTDMYKFGVNSHLGPVEAEVSHMEKRFDPGGSDVLLDPYTNSFRAAGTYPHNLVPEVEGSSTTVKLHTSYTGGLVAAATFSASERENKSSGAESEALAGGGSLSWMPATSFTLFLRYRHMETEVDNPDFVTITDATNSANTFTYPVRPSIESSTDSLMLIGRYRPARKLTLRAKYSLEEVTRDNSSDWGLRRSTSRNSISLSANSGLTERVRLGAEYKYRHVEDPAYNTDPDDSNEGTLSLAWSPFAGTSTLFLYTMGVDKRGDLSFDKTTGGRNREVEKDKLLATGTTALSDKLSLTASASYMKNETTQDIVFENSVGSVVIAGDSSYKDTSQTYSLGASYYPFERLGLHGEAVYTISEGEFNTAAPDLLGPVSLSELGDFEFKETELSAYGDYLVGGGVSLSVKYRYLDLEESKDNPFDDLEGGNAQLIMVSLKKEWK